MKVENDSIIKIILLKMGLSYKNKKLRLAIFNLLNMNNDDKNKNDNNNHK